MEFWDFAAFATFIVGGVTVVTTALNRVFDRRPGVQEQEQELRIVELARQNEQLHEQLAWHAKLLEAQDRMVKQVGTRDASEPTATVRPRGLS